MSIALGLGHKIVHIISTPFPIFIISIFPYTAYFSFLIQGPRKREENSILGFAKFSRYSQECVPLTIYYHLQSCS